VIVIKIKYNLIDVIRNSDDSYLRAIVNKKLYKIVKFIKLNDMLVILDDVDE